MDSINMAHDKYKGQDHVNRVLKFWTP